MHKICHKVLTIAIDFTGIATLLNKMGRPEVTVGVDGSLYRFHPHFHDLMEEKVKQLVNPGIKVRLTNNAEGLLAKVDKMVWY